MDKVLNLTPIKHTHRRSASPYSIHPMSRESAFKESHPTYRVSQKKVSFKIHCVCVTGMDGEAIFFTGRGGADTGPSIIPPSSHSHTHAERTHASHTHTMNFKEDFFLGHPVVSTAYAKNVPKPPQITQDCLKIWVKIGWQDLVLGVTGYWYVGWHLVLGQYRAVLVVTSW